MAAYTAITLYAVHQQSRGQGMHRSGQGLGRAVRILRTRAGGAEAVRRRFEALGTAETFAEVVHHARGLITQLRGQDIPLDYGALADQLFSLQFRDGASRVRLAWGRDFYRATSEDSESPDNPVADATSTSGEDAS
jgi:CRISPR system Cascade subunit CasB